MVAVLHGAEIADDNIDGSPACSGSILSALCEPPGRLSSRCWRPSDTILQGAPEAARILTRRQRKSADPGSSRGPWPKGRGM